MLALGQPAHQSKSLVIPEQPRAMVRSLYSEVVARHPVGIPKGADMKALSPYLSKSLLHRIDLARACEDDYYRGHKGSTNKPDIEWLEFGLFTGGMEQASPRAFRTEREQPEEDGSVRVNVRLTWGSPSKPWIWRVGVIVVLENGHSLVDDVLFLSEEKPSEVESRLSELLTAGCNGPHWIGYRKQKGGLEQQW
jgi:hypothetical protein